MNNGLVKENKNSQREFSMTGIRDALYLTGFSFIFIGYFLQSTMFPEIVNIVSVAVSPIKILGTALVLASLFVKKNYRVSFLLLSAAFLITAILVRHYSTVNLIYVIVLQLGASDIKFDSIVRLYVRLETVCILLTILFCLAGIIPNLTYFRYNSIRQAFGFIYPTDFAAHLTFLYAANSYIRGTKFKWIDVLLGLGIAIFQFSACDARLDSSLVLMAVLLFYFLSRYQRLNKKPVVWLSRFFANALYFLVPFLFGLTFFLPKLYVAGNHLTIWLDGLLSGRIHLVAEGMQKYPFTLFGQQVITNGYGGLAGQTANRNIYGYFILDSSYAITAITYGLVLSGIMLFIFWNSIRKAKLENELFLLACILIVSIHCFVAQFYFDPSYNVFLMICFSRVVQRYPLKRQNTNQEIGYMEETT